MSVPSILTPLALTAKVAFCATLVALAVGVGLAWVVAKKRFPGRELLDAVLMMPLVLPPTVLGYYLLVLVGRRSPAGSWLEEHWGFSFVFSWQGAVLAAAVVSLPIVFKAARAALEGVAADQEMAARALGSGELLVFLRVTLPLARRGILAGALLAFARGLGEFGATLMIAGNIPGRTQTLSLAVFDAVQAGKDGEGLGLSLLTSLVCATTLLLSQRLLRSRA